MSSPFYASPFQPIRNSTEPSFNSTMGSISVAYGLENAATNRIWAGGSGRAIRIASFDANGDFYFVIGSSTIVCTTSGATAVPGGTVEVVAVQAGQTHIAFASSTSVTVNVTLGRGGQ